MIPKIIHYCWLSGKPMPRNLQQCLDSWRDKMPDYEIKCWDRDRFDIHSVKYVEQACSVGKWAFAADYIRLHSVYTEGGIYLDSDVLLKKNLEKLFNGAQEEFISAVEADTYTSAKTEDEYLNKYGKNKNPGDRVDDLSLQAAVFAATKGHPFLKDCMDYYAERDFIRPDGSYDEDVIAPTIYVRAAEKYGFRYIDKTQHLSRNMTIYNSATVASNQFYLAKGVYAIHMCAGSWRDEPIGFSSGFKNKFYSLTPGFYKSLHKVRWRIKELF